MSFEPRITPEDDAVAAHIVGSVEVLALSLRSHAWSFAYDFCLTPTQGEVLRLLHGYGPLRAARLADAVGVTRASMTEVLRAMERKVLVRREHRRAPVELTTSGKNLASDVSLWRGAIFDAALSVERNERAEFARVLRAMSLLIVARDNNSIATSARRVRWPYSMMRDTPRKVKLPFDTGFD